MFTPIHTSLGALLLFQGSSGLLLHNGAVFGISSLISGCVFNPNRNNLPIIAGLVSSAAPIYLFAPSLLPTYPPGPNSWPSIASTLGMGFLLGWGTKVSTNVIKERERSQADGIFLLEWPRLHLGPHALWSLPSVPSFVDRHCHLLHHSFAHGQFRKRRPEHPGLQRHPLLHSSLSIKH